MKLGFGRYRNRNVPLPHSDKHAMRKTEEIGLGPTLRSTPWNSFGVIMDVVIDID